MRQLSSALQTLLSSQNAWLVADLITITPLVGSTIYWTSAGLDVTWDGHTYSSSGPIIARESVRQGDKLEVSTLAMTLDHGGNVTVGGVNLALAFLNGYFDEATFQLDRCFFSPDWSTPVGIVPLFSGNVSEVEPSSTSARITVTSALQRLNRMLPWALQPGCPYVLYSTACGVTKASFSASNTCASGCTATTLNLTGATSVGPPGWVEFTSGANQGLRRIIRANASGVLTLAVPLPYAPSAGDALTVVQGCDKLRTTCDGTFSNLAHFRGFPDKPQDLSAVLNNSAFQQMHAWAADQTAKVGELSEPAITTSTLPVVIGTGRVSSQVVLVDAKHTASLWTPNQTGSTSADQSIPYFSNSSGLAAAEEIVFCEGPIANVIRFWRDNVLTPLAQLGTTSDAVELMLGARTQTAWPYLAAHNLSPSPLGGVAYVRSTGIGLPSGSQPNIAADVRGFLLSSSDERVTNGALASGTGWTVSSGVTFGSIPFSNAAGCTLPNSGYVEQALSITTPGIYRLTWNTVFSTPFQYVPRMSISVGTTSGGTDIYEYDEYWIGRTNVRDVLLPAAGTYYLRFTNTAFITGTSTPNTNLSIAFNNASMAIADVSPADALSLIWTDTTWGLGLPSTSLDVDYGPDGTAATGWRAYCTAMGWSVSIVIDKQTKALDLATNLIESTNAVPVWSGGKLRIVPLGDTAVTAYGATYAPPSTAVAIGVDDLIREGDADPIVVTRRAQQVSYNDIPVSYSDRQALFQSLTVNQPDDADIQIHDRQTGGTFSSSWITNGRHARMLSSILTQRSLYVRNTYKFSLSFRHSALEKGDVVTLTDPNLGLSSRAARITTIEEDPTGLLRVEAEDWLYGVAHAVPVSVQVSDGVEGSQTGVPIAGTNPPSSLEQAEAEAQRLAIRNLYPRTLPESSPTYSWMTHDGTVFCTVGCVVGVAGSYCATSVDGVAWTSYSSAISQSYYWTRVASGPSEIIAIGINLALTAAYCTISTDHGATWSTPALLTGAVAIDRSKASGRYCVVGTNYCATSDDGGSTWTTRTIPAGSWSGVHHTGRRWLAFGTNIGATSDDDGVTWSTVSVPSGAWKAAATMAATGIVCMTGNGIATTSSDGGTTWTTAVTGLANLSSLFVTDLLFVSVHAGYASTSIDGQSWDKVLIFTGFSYLSSAAWDGTRIAACGGGVLANSLVF